MVETIWIMHRSAYAQLVGKRQGVMFGDHRWNTIGYHHAYKRIQIYFSQQLQYEFHVSRLLQRTPMLGKVVGIWTSIICDITYVRGRIMQSNSVVQFWKTACEHQAIFRWQNPTAIRLQLYALNYLSVCYPNLYFPHLI